MSLRSAIAWLCVLAGAGLALSACGGGGSSPPANAPPGLRVFDDQSCGSCHTLAAAKATGTVGPNLDGKSLTPASVEHYVRNGGGGMPSFSGLSDTQIQQVSDFVANASK